MTAVLAILAACLFVGWATTLLHLRAVEAQVDHLRTQRDLTRTQRDHTCAELAQARRTIAVLLVKGDADLTRAHTVTARVLDLHDRTRR